MAHILEQKIGQVRRRARRLLLLHAASCTLFTVLAVLLLVALADFFIRFDDRGIRVMASLAVLAAAGWAAYRYLWNGLGGAKLGDVQIAQRIERRFPGLGDRLESAIQFLKQPELEIGAGSAALRRAVIIDTESQIAQLDVDQVIEPAPTRRALACAGALLLVAVTLVAISPASAKIALARLARPLGDDAWPRYYHLEFKSPPARIAAGQNFEVELLHDARHPVPEVVEIQFRYPTGPTTHEVESEPMRWLNGALVARKDNVQRPFEYRATGGDDDTMPWRRLEVLEAPRIAQLAVTLHPPRYSGLPIEESDKAIHALKGTRIALEGTVTKKVAQATLRQEDGVELPLAVAEDGYSIALPHDAEQPWTIETTGQYWIELVDEAGLIGGSDERWDVRSIADLEPTVTIEKPATNSYVTPRGELELAIAVKDDLAIRDVLLHFGRSDRADVPDFAAPLYTGGSEAPRHTEPGLLLGGKLGESRVVTHTWRLAELELKPGTQVTFWATSSDYVPREGKSTPRTITIITPAELEERLAQRQTLVVGELQRVLKLQQDARSQTRSLDIQVSQVGEFSKREVDQAQSAELNQRQVERTLTSPTEGIPAQINEFLNELRANHVDSPGAMRQMTSILEEIERLEREHLGDVETDLTGFIKAAQAGLADSKSAEGQVAPTAKPDEAMRKRLASAGEHQDAVIDSLESLVDELGRWDNFRRFSREVADLERQQEDITKATKELGPQTLGRDFKELDEQRQADLKKLASQQSELSRRLEKTQQQMGEMSRSLEENDPLAAATIQDGLHHAREQAISTKMRESGSALEQNQLGQSAGLQEKVSQELKELQSILSNRKEQELSRLVKQLREAESELARLREQQAGLRKKMKEAEQIVDPAERKRQLERLSREQKKLAEEAQRLARKLQRLQADKAGGKTAGASNKMAAAGEQGESGDSQGADQQAAGAQRDLEEAEQQLAQRRKQAEADLAREQLARMEDSLKGLHERQKNLIQETQRLEQLRATEGRLSRTQLATLGDLARLQQALGDETAQLAEKLALTEVIQMALSGAADKMQRAAELLELRNTGMPAQSAQEAARQRLARLLAAFEKRKQSGEKKEGSGGGGGSGSGQGQEGRSDGEFVLAQLKLLKLLQEDLNDRYQEAVSGEGASSREARRELVEIAAEQGKLAELTLKLSEPPAEAPEDAPEKLPDVRETEPPLEGLPELELPDLEDSLGESTQEVPPPAPAPVAEPEEKP